MSHCGMSVPGTDAVKSYPTLYLIVDHYPIRIDLRKTVFPSFSKGRFEVRKKVYIFVASKAE